MSECKRAWKYLKGSERDFAGAPDWSLQVLREIGTENIGYDENINGKQMVGDRLFWPDLHEHDGNSYRLTIDDVNSLSNVEIIAQREPVTSADVEVVKYDPMKVDGEQRVKCGELKIDGEWHESTINKYTRDCKGVQVDVYDVLQAFDVTNPALQHLIKKALCVGIRGHKTKQQDLQDIIDSAIRAKELESNK